MQSLKFKFFVFFFFVVSFLCHRLVLSVANGGGINNSSSSNNADGYCYTIVLCMPRVCHSKNETNNNHTNAINCVALTNFLPLLRPFVSERVWMCVFANLKFIHRKELAGWVHKNCFVINTKNHFHTALLNA